MTKLRLRPLSMGAKSIAVLPAASKAALVWVTETPIRISSGKDRSLLLSGFQVTSPLDRDDVA
jgi:hypothetical protein